VEEAVLVLLVLERLFLVVARMRQSKRYGMMYRLAIWMKRIV
jgi:hypothetical protein